MAEVRHRQGLLVGHMDALEFKLRQGAVLKTLTVDVVKSSEIEGKKLDAEQVQSSITRCLGMDIGALTPADRNVEGIVEMTLDATREYLQSLTAARLFAWPASLFPTGRSGRSRVRTGAWCDDGSGPMEVVSGVTGKERVHFTVPPASRLDGDSGLSSAGSCRGRYGPGFRGGAGPPPGSSPSILLKRVTAALRGPSRIWLRHLREEPARLLQYVGANPAGA
jgi:hypothetical protein